MYFLKYKFQKFDLIKIKWYINSRWVWCTPETVSRNSLNLMAPTKQSLFLPCSLPFFFDLQGIKGKEKEIYYGSHNRKHPRKRNF